MKPAPKPVVQSLMELLESLRPLSAACKSDLEKQLDYSILPKQHILLKPNQTANHAYYLHSGFVIGYTHIGDKRLTEAFYKPGDLIVPFKSFFDQVPSQQTLQLMIKSEVLSIPYDEVKLLLHKHDDAQQIYHNILNQHYQSCMARVRDLQSMTAATRLKQLLMKYPRIEQYVTQESIASFLGITPPSLSRIKRREK